MFELLNTLYVLTPGASLHLDHDAVRVVIEGETQLRAPSFDSTASSYSDRYP